jgi:hypothetical protein
MKFIQLLDRYYEFKLRKRKKQIKKLLTGFFGQPIKLKKLFRKSSRDNIYKVLSNKEVLAVARVRNNFRLKRLAHSANQYNEMILDSKKRFKREWEKCQKAYPYLLTPEPLFKDDGIIVFRFIEGKTALEKVKNDFSNFE